MLQRYVLHSMTLCAAMLLLLAGCKDSIDEPVGTDEDYFSSVVTGQEDTLSDFAGSEVEALDEGAVLRSLIPGLAKSGAAPVTPLRYGRIIDSVRRSLTRPITRFGDTIAIANVHVTINGRYIVQALSGVDTVVIRKPYTEVLECNFRFERIASTRYPRRNWRLDAVSVIGGGTTNAAAVITELRVTTPNTTFIVTDPGNYYLQLTRWWLRLLPVLNNVPVTMQVTVQSTKADEDLVTLHYLPGTFGLHHTPFAKISEAQNGGTYTRVYEKSWTVSGSIRRYAHLMVSATTRESLYDDATGNFSSTTWGIPYKVSN